MVRLGEHLLGQMRHQGPFGFKDVFGVFGQADAVCDAENVRVDRHGWPMESHGHHHVGGLATHAGQFLHIFQIVGHNAIEIAHQSLRHAEQVFRFVVGIGNRLDVAIDFLHRCLCHVVWRRETLKQGWRGHVDALVGTLRRKNHRHQELIRVLVLQLRLSDGHVFLKIRHKGIVFLL